MTKGEMDLLWAYGAAAAELDRLSRGEGVDPLTADRQAFAASELRGRAAKLHKEIEHNLDTRAERVRRIRSAK